MSEADALKKLLCELGNLTPEAATALAQTLAERGVVTDFSAKSQELLRSERHLNDLYWKDVIASLASGVAGTAEAAALRKSTSKTERRVQAEICRKFALVLTDVPCDNRTQRPTVVAKRLLEAAKELENP